MFCCFSATKKDKNQVVKRTTEQKRGKVYLSFRPELRFQLDQTFNWAFLGSQQRRTPDQQAKQIEQMRKKQKQMEQEINSKLQQKKKLQKQRQQLQDQLSKLQQENAKKRVAVAVLNYVNLREQCQIQQYRLKL